MGPSQGRRGLGAAGPLGTLLFRAVDSAIWVTRAESWGCLSVLFLPSSRSKNWEMGTPGMSRTVSKASVEFGAEVSAEREGAQRSQTLGFLSVHRCTYLESATHSDTSKSMAFQRLPTRTG